ncbi:MAG TPA: hypothetical protein VJ850_10195 [Candidatus Limnocylindrales bacterium]|nr:hypothetical protein [Candidatus Limnocylindrales bacterium]
MTDRRGTPGPRLLLGLAVVATLLVACSTTAPSPSPLPSLPPAPAATPTDVPDTFDIPSFTPETDPPEPTDTDTGSPGTPPCDIDAVKASHGLIDSDGDDRTTEVVLVAADTCSIDAYPELSLADSKGHVVAQADAAGAGAIDLVGGVAYTTEVRVSNWCIDVAPPVAIRIAHDGASIVVTGDSFPDPDNLPPCVHQDAPPVLSGTAWAPKA